MTEEREKTVADIVREDYRTADVFKKHNINFCCSGDISVAEACALQNIDHTVVENDIEEAKRRLHIPANVKFDEWKIDFLIDYIVNIHHAYLKESLPELEAKLLGFMDGHKKKYPALEKIYETFMQLSGELTFHNRHEEEVIFPYIKQVETTFRRKEIYGNLFVRTLRKPLNAVEKEHAQISVLLDQLKSQANGYNFPEKACTNHQVIYHKLREFHDDMIQHKHLENNILFPKAIRLEQELLRG
jgi:regulator of cell morphogenesis and NO signaling